MSQTPIILNKVNGPGFGCPTFGFLNGFAVPIQQIRPTVFQPKVDLFRPQFQYIGHCKFPCPNQPQLPKYRDANSGVLKHFTAQRTTLPISSLNNEMNRVMNCGREYASEKLGFIEKYDGPLFSQKDKANKIPDDVQPFPFHQYEFSDPWSESATNSFMFSTIKGEQAKQCTHLTAELEPHVPQDCPNCRPILSTSELSVGIDNTGRQWSNLNDSTHDGNDNKKSTKFQNGLDSKLSSGIKRKCGYGIQDDYVLHGKFVNADGNWESEDDDQDRPNNKIKKALEN